MAITININGELRLDQSSGLQDDDIDLTNTLGELNSTFSAALLALGGDLALSQAQKDFAADTNAASESNYVTVDTDGEEVNDLFFSDPDGNLFDGDQVFYSGSALKTVNGDSIYLWSLSGNLVIATTSGTLNTGDVVAAFYLDEANDSLSAGVQMVTFIPLDHPDTGATDETVNWSDLLNISAAGSTSFDFDALKSGSSLWVAVGSETGGVLVTGGNPVVNNATGKKTNASDVIHTSQGGDGTTIGVNNQLFDNAGETAVFTLVTGLNTITGPAGATGDYVVDPNTNDAKLEGIDYDGYLNVTGAGIYLSQSQGSPSTTKSFDVELWSAGGGTTEEEGFGYISGLASDDPVAVGTVTVINDDNEVVGVWAVGDSGDTFHSSSANGETDVTVTINGNHIEVDGVFGEFTVSWTSLNDAEFNRFTLESESGQFDVGRVDITSGLVITEPVGDTMFVDDDGPSLPPATQAELELITDDTYVGIPSSDTLSTDDIFTGTPTFGTDGPSLIDPIQYSLRVQGTDPYSGLVDTETGFNILLQEEAGGDVVGILDENGDDSIGAGEDTVAIRYSLSTPDPLDLDTEVVTFTQYRSVKHDDPTDPDEDGLPGSAPATVLGGLIWIDQTAIDGDEDPSGVVSFDLGAVTQLWDDGPSIGDTNGEIDDGIVDFAAGDSVTNDLEGDVGEDPNSSPYTLTDFTDSITVNGVELHGVADSTTKVTYWADTGGNDIYGDAGDTAYYTMELGDQGGSGDYTFTVLVDPPPAFTPFDFTDLPSGQNLFGCIAANKSNLSGLALFVVAKNADVNANGEMTNSSHTVNTSKGGGPVTIGNTNQMIDPGEGTYFAYLSDPDDNMVAGVPGGLTQNTADDADTVGFQGTIPTTIAQVEIVQVQGGSPATINIKAYDINPGVVDLDSEARSFVEDPTATDDPVNVSAVRVYDDDGELIESWSDANFDGNYDLILDDPNVDVDFTETTTSGVYYATISGVQDDYTIEFETETGHDLALVEGVAGKFDIGGFNLLQSTATPDQKLDFEATVTDGDGDTDVATWQIGIDGTGSFHDGSVSGVVI